MSTVGLTAKEAEVIHLVARGRISKEIALDLGIDEESVEDRLRRAMRRLGAHTRAQLVAIYLRTRKSVPVKRGSPPPTLWPA